MTALALSGYEPDVAGSASAMIGTGQYLFGALAAPVVGLGGQSSAAFSMAAVIAALSLPALLTRVILVRTPPGAAELQPA